MTEEIIIEIAKIGGPIVVALVVIYWIVQKFLKFCEKQEDNFNEVIKNHLNENSKSSQNLALAIKELLIFLKGRNGFK